MTRALALSALLMAAACGQAEQAPPAASAPPTDWTLSSEDSRISFGSIKSGELIETHYFPELSGAIAADGAATVEIALDAVETKIDIRNERMREIFFETAAYPTATLTTAIDQSTFSDAKVGERRTATVTGNLSLHGAEAEIIADVFVTRIAEARISVESAEPVIVFVDDFNLGSGLERLREIANLPAITAASPVTFSLVFEG